MINFVNNILKENLDMQDLSWADNANLTPIKDEEERFELIFNTIFKVRRYKNYSIYRDGFDGVVYWDGLPGGYTGMATPEWDKHFEIPVDIMWNQGNDYDNVGIIETPEFRYVEELVEWYSKDYFEKVSKALENFIEFGDTPGIIESYYGTNNNKKFISENLESNSNDILLEGHKNYNGKVLVQRSFDKPEWTIKARRGSEAGIVLGYDKTVYLENVTFVIDDKQNLMESKMDDIYAGVVGTIVESNITNVKDWVPVTYNPYNSKTFTRVDNNEPIFRAKRAILKNEKEIYVKL